MLISLGGKIEEFLNDQSEFDSYIIKNFNTALKLAQISNSSLK